MPSSKKSWTKARTYFSELLESYPQSPLRADAKLGVGDTFLGENNSASYVYAQNEFREFLAFYPTNPRADYAQMQLGMVHFNQMLSPQRDQTETREAIKELQTFVDRYPNSPLINQVKQRLREAKDRLSDSDMIVANFYLSIRLYTGAEPRYRHVLQTDPDYTRKDSLYFHLGETLEKTNKKAEALPVLRAPAEGIREKRVSAGSHTARRPAQAGTEAWRCCRRIAAASGTPRKVR